MDILTTVCVFDSSSPIYTSASDLRRSLYAVSCASGFIYTSVSDLRRSLYAVRCVSGFIYTSASDLRRKLCVGFHLYFCVVVRVNVQYTCGPLVCNVHGPVACVTRSTMAKAGEVARWRSILAVTAANKYQIII